MWTTISGRGLPSRRTAVSGQSGPARLAATVAITTGPARLAATVATTRSDPPGTGPSARVLHLRPELEHGLGVHLADPRLGDAQDLPDLGQGESLVVVEGDHDLLPLTEAVDRVGQDAFLSPGTQRRPPGPRRPCPPRCRPG